MKKMMNFVALAFGAVALMIGTAGQVQAAPIYLSPGTAGVIGVDTGPANCEPGCIETVFGLPAGSLLYKGEQGGGADSGSFASSYSTAFFNSPSDPEDATISFVLGQPSISCPNCYLAIKDGAASPNYYFYNLGVAQGANPIWDGVSDIIMTGFWGGKGVKGAISHVSIWGAPTGGGTPGGGGTSGGQIPEPASLLLLAGGIGAAAFSARRRRQSR